MMLPVITSIQLTTLFISNLIPSFVSSKDTICNLVHWSNPLTCQAKFLPYGQSSQNYQLAVTGGKVGLLIPASEARNWQHVKCKCRHVSNAKEMAMSSLAQLTGKTSDVSLLTRSNIIDKLKPEQNGNFICRWCCFQTQNVFCCQWSKWQ